MNRILLLKRMLLCCITCLIALQSMEAQDITPVYKIKGIVVDSFGNKPVEFITLSILDSAGTPLKAGISKTDGSFSFDGLQAKKYTIVVHGVGYLVRQLPVDLSARDASATMDLGLIDLIPNVKNIAEVVVISVRPLVKQELGRISYNMQADPESKVKSVLDMMHKIPYLSVDANGNVLLKGNSNYRILINGKPSSMLERNPMEVLRSIPASTILRIEVITTPPPKYEAEGLAGIINIVTTQRLANGYNGSVNLYQRFPVGGPGIGTSFAFKQGKFALSGYAGGNIYNTPGFNNTFKRKTTGINADELWQSGNRKIDNKSGYIGTELSFEADSLNLLSGQVNFNGSGSETSLNQSSSLSNERGLLKKYDLYDASNYSGRGMDFGLNYQHNFKRNRSRIITFSYGSFNYNNNTGSDIGIYNRYNFNQPDFKQMNKETFKENTVQVDYVHPVKSLNIELGAKAIWRDNTSKFNYLGFDTTSGSFVQVPTFSNEYNYRQDVYAWYNNYQYRKEKWGLSAGLRVEQTATRVIFFTTGTALKQNYFNVIPSLAYYHTINNSSISIGFVQRIRRPSITRLNPYVDRTNPNVEISGNPNLKPVLLNDIQLGYGYSKKISINAGLGYSFFNKLDLRVYTFNPTTNITTVTFANVGKGNRIGLDVNVNYPITPKVNFSLNGNVAHFTISGEVDNALLTNKWLTFYVSPTTKFNFSKGWKANANLTVNSSNPSSFQGTTNAFATTSFSVNKEYLNGKFVLSAGVNNPFGKYRNNILEVRGPGFEERGVILEYFRSFSFALNYKFGQLQGSVKKSSRNIKNDDVSNRKD